MRNLDCIFISYDECNADDNYFHLLSIIPTAKRVHGIKGFDSAHKKAAEISTTDYFITVDADTVIDPIFFNQKVNLNDAEQHVFAVRNAVTGLSSGNGSIKVWNKHSVLTKDTHENANSINASLDFWQVYNSSYYLEKNFGITFPNLTKFHAFRSSFRECFKSVYTLLNKDKSNPSHFIKELTKNKIEVLCSVGLDSMHGIFSILGARVGLLFAVNDSIGASVLHDYDKLNPLCKEFINRFICYESIIEEILQHKYISAANDISIQLSLLSMNESIWFKSLRTMNVSAIENFLQCILPQEKTTFCSEFFGTKVILLSPNDSRLIYNSLNKD